MATWFSAVIGGTAALAYYKAQPGTVSEPPLQVRSKNVLAPAGRHRLVMFAHPKCACTRASITELQKLIPRLNGRADVTVVMYRPAGDDGFANTDLVERVRAMSAVELRFDDGGALAKQFGAETSGQTLLYAPDGTLKFRGGITVSRGHEGDNPGSDRIAAWVNEGSAELAQAPVFGCGLNDETGGRPQ